MFYAFVFILISALFIGAMVVDIRGRQPHHSEKINTNVKRGDTENYLAGDNKYLNSGS